MITAALVKELREKTGAGMMDCKKALTETDGDIAKAIDWLRQKVFLKLLRKLIELLLKVYQKLLLMVTKLSLLKSTLKQTLLLRMNNS